MNFLRLFLSIPVFFFALTLRADGPRDNLPDSVRPVPPLGIEVPAEDRVELEAGLKKLGTEVEFLRGALKTQPAKLALLPDVEIFHKAVRYALTYNEFFKKPEIAAAKSLLRQGAERAEALRIGKTPWITATGLVVRAYVSKIDGSVQPYGLVVPPTFKPGAPHRHRLDCWFHGRGETLSEVNFLDQRQKSPGEFTPPDAIVLHLYGRYCNANKFAGETDLFEALESVKRRYPIDENRIVVRGFSMGGAACWQFATHFAGLWAAAAPGAGFAESAEFLKVFQNEPTKPPQWEQTLWHLYDATDYAANLFNCPTVAYSGEIDRQKQAADIMAKAIEAEGMKLTHIIGPKTAHKYEPEAKAKVCRRIDEIVARGRNPVPSRVRFTTWTLRYNQMLWVTLDGMEKHWERARVDAEIADATTVRITTQNADALTLSVPPQNRPLTIGRRPKVILDGQELAAPPVPANHSWVAHFRKVGKQWTAVPSADDGSLRKRHGLQGPIDDGFMDSFVMVKPTGKPLNEKVGAWAAAEMKHAIEHWRKQFRGDARVIADTAVTNADIASSNLVLWGDPSSNKLLAKIVDKLPVHWDAQAVKLGSQSFVAGYHVPVLIYPNPLNQKRYVVLNSGFTFREYDYLNNARQTPKLPDYAIVDVSVPVSSRAPGGIVTAGFFGERWELPAAK
ncbi:MAG: prolyl oligopeptidase family serine peptidase [Verrucomicrobia bacterium]|nr:prolyl oligopeptidase family serine peptidase [Verrucomicrobiota bacterium]